MTKRAAELSPGDVVTVAGSTRTVSYVEFTGRAIDSNGTSEVLVHWHGKTRSSSVGADKEFEVNVAS